MICLCWTVMFVGLWGCVCVCVLNRRPMTQLRIPPHRIFLCDDRGHIQRELHSTADLSALLPAASLAVASERDRVPADATASSLPSDTVESSEPASQTARRRWRVVAQRSVVDEAAVQQLERSATVLSNLVFAVGMPDLHAGQSLPVGAVWATSSRIFPELIGSDIGCGMLWPLAAVWCSS
jgi:hypothetical protein